MKKLVIAFLVLGSANLAAAGLESRVKYESQSHSDRVAILEEADRCIKSAETKEAYKNCEDKEKQARKASRANIYEMRKSDILKKLGERKQKSKNPEAVARMEKAESCVSSASNGKELKKCRSGFKRRK